MECGALLRRLHQLSDKGVALPFNTNLKTKSFSV